MFIRYNTCLHSFEVVSVRKSIHGRKIYRHIALANSLRYTKKGFEDVANRLGAIDRELRLDQLRNRGDNTRTKVIRSSKEKANDAKRQRKQKNWLEGC